MNKKSIYLGNTRIKYKSAKVEGQFVEIENEKFYANGVQKITAVHWSAMDHGIEQFCTGDQLCSFG